MRAHAKVLGKERFLLVPEMYNLVEWFLVGGRGLNASAMPAAVPNTEGGRQMHASCRCALFCICPTRARARRIAAFMMNALFNLPQNYQVRVAPIATKAPGISQAYMTMAFGDHTDEATGEWRFVQFNLIGSHDASATNGVSPDTATLMAVMALLPVLAPE